MTVSAFVSILTFIGVSWILGVRLLVLARSTRQTPELCMGASLLLIGRRDGDRSQRQPARIDRDAAHGDAPPRPARDLGVRLHQQRGLVLTFVPPARYVRWLRAQPA